LVSSLGGLNSPSVVESDVGSSCSKNSSIRKSSKDNNNKEGMRVRFSLPSIMSIDAAAEGEQHANSGTGRGPDHMSGDGGLYTLSQLSDFRVWRTLPDVVPTERETYLSSCDFREVFAMDKEEFAKLPRWRRDCMKKGHGLF